ncbi:MAG: GNAT family N-acetyltransferase [Methanobacteriota archaeon]|nr:MAG: GNAT family N-acetyltransferase [Euryarchaeota archaeon]
MGPWADLGTESAANGLRIEELALSEAVRELSADWPRFRDRAGTSPFLAPDYLALWARIVGGLDTCRIVTARRGGELVGFGPFMLSDDPFGPFSVETLKFVGNNVGYPGDVLYSEVAAAESESVRAILRHAARWGATKWDFGYLPPTSRTHAAAHEVLGAPRNGVPLDRQPYVGLSLPPSWQAFLASLSSNARRDFRRKSNRLSASGDVEVRVARSPEGARAVVHRMIENHGRWSAGTDRAGWFGDERVGQFLEEGATLLAGRGMFVGFTLEISGEQVAWNAGAFDGVRYFEQIMSYDRSFTLGSPGLVLGFLAVQRLIDLGTKKVELGPGFDQRKEALGATLVEHERLQGYRGWARPIAAIHRRWRGRRFAS